MKIKIAIVLAVVLLTIAFLTSKLLAFQIHKDHRGIVYNTLTGELDKENVLEPGTITRLPWNKIYTMYVGGNGFDIEFDALDKDANSFNVSLSCRYTPIPEKVGFLFYNVGTEYKDRVLIPELRSITRQVMGNFSAGDIYSYKRQEIEQEIIDRTEEMYENYYVNLNQLRISSVQLSPELRKTLEEHHKERELAKN